jgi:hypothetical protein
MHAWRISLLAAALLVTAPLAAQQSPKKEGGGSGGLPGTPPGMGTGGAAKKAPEPGSLEDLLEKGLRHNADIHAAEAKVREAEAELNRVRHQVVAKVVSVRNDLDAARRMLGHLERINRTVATIAAKGNASQQELEAAAMSLEKQRAEVVRLDAELEAMTGTWQKRVASLAFAPDGQRLYSMMADGAVRVWDPSTGREMGAYSSDAKPRWLTGRLTTVQQPMADRLKAALDKTVKISESPEELPLREALDYLFKRAAIDVPVRFLGKLDDKAVGLMKGELPVGAWLQAFEDAVPDARFVVRDYGILVTTRERAPEGSMTVSQFWKQGEKKVEGGSGAKDATRP